MESRAEGPGPGSIIDIRRESRSADLKEGILEGLRQEPKKLPSLLLWNDKGIKLYERLKAECDDYYPSRHEDNLIRRNARGIVATMPNNGTLVELGSGYDCSYL